MKKILVFLVLAMFLGLSSSAMAFTSVPTYWDLNTVDNSYWGVDPGSNGVTGVFNEITYYAETHSTIAGNTVTDVGAGYATGLNGTADNEELNNIYGSSPYELTFNWDNLQGQVTGTSGGTITAKYTGGDINFHIDKQVQAINDASFTNVDPTNTTSPSLGLLDNIGDLTDGTLVATVHVTGGSYALNMATGVGSYELTGTFTYLLDNFWYNGLTGQDLHDTAFQMNWLIAYTHGDNDTNSTQIVTDPTTGISQVYSTHDSSIEVGVVPEPTTMLLLGLGLLFLGGFARKEYLLKK